MKFFVDNYGEKISMSFRPFPGAILKPEMMQQLDLLWPCVSQILTTMSFNPNQIYSFIKKLANDEQAASITESELRDLWSLKADLLFKDVAVKSI